MDLLGLPWPMSIAFWLMIVATLVAVVWTLAYNPREEDVPFVEGGWQSVKRSREGRQ